MESTYSSYSATKEEKGISAEGQTARKAVVGFLSGAAIVFAIAIYYCMSTDHQPVAAALGGAFALICILGGALYRSSK